MSALARLTSDVHRWTGLLKWATSRTTAAAMDVRKRNQIGRVKPIQAILLRGLPYQAERQLIEAECRDQLAQAIKERDAYIDQQGDGLLEIFEDAVTEGEGFTQIKIFEAIREAMGKDVHRKRKVDAEKEWQQEERVRRTAEARWQRGGTMGKMNGVFKDGAAITTKDGVKVVPEVVYGPPARAEVRKIATGINKRRGYFADAATHILRLAGYDEGEGYDESEALAAFEADGDDWVDAECTLDRFEHAISRIRIDTGVGADGFSAYLLRKAPLDVRVLYWKALQGCIRTRRFPPEYKEWHVLLAMKAGEDARDLARRRDLYLMCHGQKIADRMLTHGEYDKAASRTVPGSQAGFTSDRGASEQSWSLRAHMEECKREGRPCYRGYLDFGTYFMSICRECMWRVERASGVKPEVSAIMMELHSELTCRYETAWGLTDLIPLEEGVGQGAISAPVRSKLMLSVMQRVVSRVCEGFKFTGSTRSVPQLYYADDGAYVASSAASLQLMFDTSWLVARTLGLTIGIKANGKKTAWSGTYWEGGQQHEVTGLTMRLPDKREIPQVTEYQYLGGGETSGWAGRHDKTIETVQRKCIQMIKLIGRVPILGPEQMRRAMSLAVAGITGFYARSTPIPLVACKQIEAVYALRC